MKVLELLRRRRARPEQLAIAPIITARFQLTLVKCRKKNPVARYARRRRRPRHVDLPERLFAGTDLYGRLGRERNARTVWPAKGRPTRNVFRQDHATSDKKTNQIENSVHTAGENANWTRKYKLAKWRLAFFVPVHD